MDQTPSFSSTTVQIEETWKLALADEFQQPYFAAIKAFLVAEKNAGKTIYPPGPLIFNAFNKTPLDQVKVVVLGQDPYIKPGEAMGLSFSVSIGVRTPPSLLNVYKELHRDLGMERPTHGDLTAWTEQGVLLINSSLSVEAGKSNSHAGCGWVRFTDAVIAKISEATDGVAFMLWGNYARGKKNLIDPAKHLVLESVHPSPLAGNGFIGCGHFSKANEFLEKKGKEKINWAVL